jgi:hypothetical protein
MVITGKVKWACVHSPNTKYEPCWVIDVILDKETQQALRDAGLGERIREKDGDTIIQIKRRVERRDGSGKENFPPKVIDMYHNSFESPIGNGSICNVQFQIWDSTNKFGAFKGTDLQAVQVVEHVAYGGEEELPRLEENSQPLKDMENPF